MLHRSHHGAGAILRRARETLYWPSMTQDIKDRTDVCTFCHQYEAAQAKLPLMPHEIPERPWEKVATDMFEYQRKDYSILVDYFSGFIEVDELPDTLSCTVIKALKKNFARHGRPEVVVSDNGPQYTSKEFVNFAVTWGFKHQTSSPGNSQANGKAEAAVKVVKTLMKKADSSNSDFFLSLLDQRNTPTQGHDTSPAQRSFGRRTLTLLPTVKSLLQPTGINTKDIQRRIKDKQDRQKEYFDRRTRDLPPLEEGDVVRLQPFVNKRGVWAQGSVIRRLDERSYEVASGNSIYRRNRAHLRATKERLPATEPEPLPRPLLPPPTQVAQPSPRNPFVATKPSQPTTRTQPPPVVKPTPPPPASVAPAGRTRSGRAVNLPTKYAGFQMGK